MDAVKEFFKKQGIAFYVLIVAAIMTVVAVVMYSADVKIAYFYEASADAGTLAFSSLAIVMLVAAVVLSQFKFADNLIVKIVIDVVVILAVAFIITPMMRYIGSRVYHFAVVLGSDLEKGNDAAFAAVNHSIITVVMYVISLVLAVVGSYFAIVRKKA